MGSFHVIRFLEVPRPIPKGDAYIYSDDWNIFITKPVYLDGSRGAPLAPEPKKPRNVARQLSGARNTAFWGG